MSQPIGTLCRLIGLSLGPKDAFPAPLAARRKRPQDSESGAQEAWDKLVAVYSHETLTGASTNPRNSELTDDGGGCFKDLKNIEEQ